MRGKKKPPHPRKYRDVIEPHAKDGYSLGQIRDYLRMRFRVNYKGPVLRKYIEDELGIEISRTRNTGIPHNPYVTHNIKKHNKDF